MFEKTRIIFSLFLVLVSLSSSLAQFEIKADIKGFQGDTLMLGYFYGEKQYIRDTAVRNDNGLFVFAGDTLPDPGVYMLVIPPENRFLQILIDEQDYTFQFEAHYDSLAETVLFQGSEDNTLFYKYLSYLTEARTYADNLRTQLNAAVSERDKSTFQSKLDSLDGSVKELQNNILRQYPETFTALLIRSGQEIDVPAFEELPENERQLKKYRYYREHYFDNYDLKDDRLLRSPILFNRIENFIDKLTPQDPDSINVGLDELFAKMDLQSETFKFYLIHFLNKYARSKVVGQDAVYVHLVDNYYAKGLAPWTEEKQLKKILENAETLRPILVGKIAPDIALQTRDKKRVTLHEIDSDYTVLFFWAPDCGHCKKKMPEMIEFYKTYKANSVEVFAVCTKVTDKVAECWEYIDEKEGMEQWLNLVDPYLLSRYKQIYDIKTTPTIYVLDHNKKILSKRIGVEQLYDVMDHILEQMNNTDNETGSESN